MSRSGSDSSSSLSLFLLGTLTGFGPALAGLDPFASSLSFAATAAWHAGRFHNFSRRATRNSDLGAGQSRLARGRTIGGGSFRRVQNEQHLRPQFFSARNNLARVGSLRSNGSHGRPLWMVALQEVAPLRNADQSIDHFLGRRFEVDRRIERWTMKDALTIGLPSRATISACRRGKVPACSTNRKSLAESMAGAAA